MILKRFLKITIIFLSTLNQRLSTFVNCLKWDLCDFWDWREMNYDAESRILVLTTNNAEDCLNRDLCDFWD